MAQNRITDDLHVAGGLSCDTFSPPDGCITDDAVLAAANIAASKLEHQFPVSVFSASAAAEVTGSVTQTVHICQAAVTIHAVEAVATSARTSGDKHVRIDVLRGSAGSYSTVLTTPMSMTTTGIITGSISTATLADGDSLQIKLSACGSTGTNCKGACVTVWLREGA